MAKVIDIVSRALRLLRVTDADSAVDARDFETSVVALNAMCTRWEASGISFGWTPVSIPEDVISCPPEFEEGLTYNLAVRLRPEYGTGLDQDVIATASASLSALRRDVFVANPLNARSAMPGQWFRYNIYSDSYN